MCESHLELKVPPNIGYLMVKSWFGCEPDFKKWRKAVELSQENTEREMDLVTHIRRNRMHGFALTFLTSNRDRFLSSMLAFSLHLPEGECHERVESHHFADTKDWWHRNENLSGHEKFLVAIFKRYRRNRALPDTIVSPGQVC